MFIRLLKYSIKNILRNKFLSFSSILILTLLMFFINILLVVHNVSFKLIDSINSKLTISLYLSEEYDANSIEVKGLKEDITNNFNEIEYIYKNKETVLKELQQKDPELVKIIEKDNPLPETISIQNIKISEYDALNRIIENKLFILSNIDNETNDHFSHYTLQYKRITKIINVLNILQIWLYIVIWVFIVSIFIIIYSIIGNFIYYYRHEISITRLVWWSKVFIYWPFSLQWMIYSIISFLINIFIFILFVKNLELLFIDSYSSDFLFNNIYIIFFIELCVFVFIGGISWFLSSKKYLK